MAMVELDDIFNKLSDIYGELMGINESIKTIAEFFEKWTEFNGKKPVLKVEADADIAIIADQTK